MSQKGFSLIELLTGMAIAAIAVNVAVPPVTGLIESVSRENTARQLAGAMGHARTQAILRNQTVVIHGVEGDWSHGWNVILDISGAGHEDKNNPVLSERYQDGRVSIVGNRPVRQYVRFSSLGEPLLPGGAFQAGTLHICAREGGVSHHQVVLSRSGRVSLRSDKAEQALCSQQGANA